MLQRLPVVFALDRAGLVGHDGPTHHGAFDLSYLRMIPNMVVMAPSSHEQLQHMLCTALACDGPVALRYPRGLAARFTSPARLQELPIGEGGVLEEGEQVAIVGIGTGVGMGRDAAALLRERGVRPTVVDARFVKPLDTALLDRLAETVHERIVTVEENVLAGGFGSAVLEHFAGSGVCVLPFGLPDSFVAYGQRDGLLAEIGLTPEAIAGSIVAARPGLARIS